MPRNPGSYGKRQKLVCVLLYVARRTCFVQSALSGICGGERKWIYISFAYWITRCGASVAVSVNEVFNEFICLIFSSMERVKSCNSFDFEFWIDSKSVDFLNEQWKENIRRFYVSYGWKCFLVEFQLYSKNCNSTKLDLSRRDWARSNSNHLDFIEFWAKEIKSFNLPPFL